MLFVPPSMPLMIPEAFAIQDRGDFKLVYYKTTKFTEFESWIQDTRYFESQVEWLNQKFSLPYDVTIGVAECGGVLDNPVNAFYSPSEKEIIYCYELMAEQYRLWIIYGYMDMNSHQVFFVDHLNKTVQSLIQPLKLHAKCN